MSQEPGLYGKYGEQLLGPWDRLDPDVQHAWTTLHNRVAWRRMTGRPLGAASGGDPGFWDRLGQDEGGMPAHLPMGVTQDGQGPANDAEAHHWICWCGDDECPLTLALTHAWRSGRFTGPAWSGEEATREPWTPPEDVDPAVYGPGPIA